MAALHRQERRLLRAGPLITQTGRFFDIDTKLDYDTVRRLVARWEPYAGMVYFHLLLQSLVEAGTIPAQQAF